MLCPKTHRKCVLARRSDKHTHNSIGTMQVLLLWLMSFWLLGVWILPTCLDFAGYSPDDLSSRGQALMHLIIDFGQLGLTIAILYQRLKAYRPWRLGWFRSYWQPIHKWLGPVLGAAVLFPLLASVAEQAQVACFWWQLWYLFFKGYEHSVMCRHKLIGF